MKIIVHIDRLVLDGLELGPGQPARLRAALERELVRLMRAPGAPVPVAGASPRFSATAPALRGGEPPEAVGANIAGALHRALGSTR